MISMGYKLLAAVVTIVNIIITIPFVIPTLLMQLQTSVLNQPSTKGLLFDEQGTFSRSFSTFEWVFFMIGAILFVTACSSSLENFSAVAFFPFSHKNGANFLLVFHLLSGSSFLVSSAILCLLSCHHCSIFCGGGVEGCYICYAAR